MTIWCLWQQNEFGLGLQREGGIWFAWSWSCWSWTLGAVGSSGHAILCHCEEGKESQICLSSLRQVKWILCFWAEAIKSLPDRLQSSKLARDMLGQNRSACYNGIQHLEKLGCLAHRVGLLCALGWRKDFNFYLTGRTSRYSLSFSLLCGTGFPPRTFEHVLPSHVSTAQDLLTDAGLFLQ